jgi:hypothetical protein
MSPSDFSIRQSNPFQSVQGTYDGCPEILIGEQFGKTIRFFEPLFASNERGPALLAYRRMIFLALVQTARLL